MPAVRPWRLAALMTCELESTMRLIMFTRFSHEPLHASPLTSSAAQSPQRALRHDLHSPMAGTSRWLKQFIYPPDCHDQAQAPRSRDPYSWWPRGVDCSGVAGGCQLAVPDARGVFGVRRFVAAFPPGSAGRCGSGRRATTPGFDCQGPLPSIVSRNELALTLTLSQRERGLWGRDALLKAGRPHPNPLPKGEGSCCGMAPEGASTEWFRSSPRPRHKCLGWGKAVINHRSPKWGKAAMNRRSPKGRRREPERLKYDSPGQRPGTPCDDTIGSPEGAR
jgi:hypothetical protein